MPKHASTPKPARIALIFTVFIVLWILSGLVIRPSGTPASKDDGAQQAPLPSVRFLQGKAAERTRSISVYGVTEAARRIDLKAEVEGKVISIDAREGSLVNQGDLILSIEPRDRQAVLEKAKALVNQREIEFEAARSLEQKELGSKKKTAEALSALEQAKADEINAQVALDNTQIRAPFDGFLEKINVEAGTLVGPNVRIGEGSFNEGSNIVTIVQKTPFIATGQLSELYINEIEPGQSAEAELVTGQKRSGQVTYIGHIADPVTRTFRIEVEIDNREGDIRSGVTSSITIPLEIQKVHAIPSSALSLNDQGELGIKLLEDMRDQEGVKRALVKFHKIEVFDYEGSDVFVTGLPEEISLITVGHAFVREGDEVTAQPDAGKTAQ